MPPLNIRPVMPPHVFQQGVIVLVHTVILSPQGDLADALEGLEAANRLSDQLDRKEEALVALKEEGQYVCKTLKHYC